MLDLGLYKNWLALVITGHPILSNAEEEIAHVTVGVSWFLTVCRKMGCMPDKTFTGLYGNMNPDRYIWNVNFIIL